MNMINFRLSSLLRNRKFVVVFPNQAISGLVKIVADNGRARQSFQQSMLLLLLLLLLLRSQNASIYFHRCCCLASIGGVR
jgi:hypothetical protein